MKFHSQALILLLLGTVGCGSTTSTDNTLAGPGTLVLHVGVIAPIDSGLSSFGRGIRNSVQLAVDQANASNPISGVHLEVVVKDDGSNPAQGAAGASQLATDAQLIGVVGTYNSGVAAQVLPILQPAQIAMVSPANTDPSLTQGSDPAHPVRPFPNYFRLVVPDNVQGPALARYAYAQGYRKAGVITESKSVSQGLANTFQTAFLSLGGSVTAFQTVPTGTTDYSAFLTNITATQPDLLFYGGEYQGAALVRDQAVQQGLTVPLMGGDGVKDPAYISAAGASCEGDFASSVGAPAAALPNATAYFAAYQQAKFVDPPSDYGPYAYDATNLLIQTARARLAQGGALTPTFRTNFLGDIQNAQLTGTTGPISFDSFGDTKNKVLTIYRVQGGQFQAQSTVTVP